MYVRHRIDGLEKSERGICKNQCVRHRIDGLETIPAVADKIYDVRHRIDGLESNLPRGKAFH